MAGGYQRAKKISVTSDKIQYEFKNTEFDKTKKYKVKHTNGSTYKARLLCLIDTETNLDLAIKNLHGRNHLPQSLLQTASENESPPPSKKCRLEIKRRKYIAVNDKREYLYKVLVIGELGVGKTSIIKRYVHQFFSQHYRATIGVDFALKVLNWDSQNIIRLQLWDIAGQERFGNMTRVYYKEAVGAFIVFDVTRGATLDAVIKWKQDLDSKVQLSDGSPIPCILLANKCDKQNNCLADYAIKMDDYCKERNFSGWFETSAKENINIEESAKFLVSKILQNDQIIRNDVQDKLSSEIFALNKSSVNSKKVCTC